MGKDDFAKNITIEPGFDGRKGSDPKYRTKGMKSNADYGIHGCELLFMLTGIKGSIQFRVMTDWFLPHVQRERGMQTTHYIIQPSGADVGYHSPIAMYKGQDPIQDNCPYVPGNGACYYDGSGLRAQEWVEQILLSKGSDGIWEAMEEEYRQRFDS
jgi:hypothetical protein